MGNWGNKIHLKRLQTPSKSSLSFHLKKSSKIEHSIVHHINNKLKFIYFILPNVISTIILFYISFNFLKSIDSKWFLDYSINSYAKHNNIVSIFWAITPLIRIFCFFYFWWRILCFWNCTLSNVFWRECEVCRVFWKGFERVEWRGRKFRSILDLVYPNLSKRSRKRLENLQNYPKALCQIVSHHLLSLFTTFPAFKGILQPLNNPISSHFLHIFHLKRNCNIAKYISFLDIINFWANKRGATIF